MIFCALVFAADMTDDETEAVAAKEPNRREMKDEMVGNRKEEDV
jgi:hypothetical protein